MQLIDQTIDGVGSVLFGDVGQAGIACGGGGAGVAEQLLDMAQTQALFEQVGSQAVAKGMDGYFFLIPQCCTTAFMAAWAPPRSICVVALRMRSDEPTALGNSNRGLRCLLHKARSAW